MHTSLKKIVIVLVVVLLTVSFSGCRKESKTLPSNGTPQTRLVTIKSNPEGAMVFVDNNSPVTTPVKIKLALGTHFITFRKKDYYDFVMKDAEIKEDTDSVSVVLVKPLSEEEGSLFATSGPILFGLPHFACCSAGAISYSNIFYGGTYTISGITILDSFDLVFPSGKKVHFNTKKADYSKLFPPGSYKNLDPNKLSGRIREFSQVVTFDELGGYEIVSNEEHKYYFGVDYKPTILSPTLKMKDLFPKFEFKNAIAVPVNKEVSVKVLITDANGNPVRNKSLGVYGLKTDENGIVRFNVKIKEDSETHYCPAVYVNNQSAEVRIYADILAWGYYTARFTKNGHFIKSSMREIGGDIKVISLDNDIYMPYYSFCYDMQTWYQSDDHSGFNKEIISPLKKPSVIYTNAFISKDSGLHWTSTDGFDFNTIAADPSNPNVIYGYSYTNTYGIAALFKSEDYGTHFVKIENAEFGKQIVIDSKDSNTIYLATYKGLLKSNDGGKTWDYSCDPRKGNVESIAVNPENSNIVFLSTGGGFFKSEDGCKTWKEISLVKNDSQEGTVNCIVFDPVNTNTIYAGTERALFVSKNGGKDWKKLANFIITRNGTIAVNPVRHNEIYIYSYGDGIYKSQDYGKHFAKINFPFNLTNAGITVNSLGELLVNADGIPFKLNNDGGFVPLGGEFFFRNGPKWKIMNGKFYVAINTINSRWIRGIVTDKAIEFYKIADMIP